MPDHFFSILQLMVLQPMGLAFDQSAMKRVKHVLRIKKIKIKICIGLLQGKVKISFCLRKKVAKKLK